MNGERTVRMACETKCGEWGGPSTVEWFNWSMPIVTARALLLCKTFADPREHAQEVEQATWAHTIQNIRSSPSRWMIDDDHCVIRLRLFVTQRHATLFKGRIRAGGHRPLRDCDDNTSSQRPSDLPLGLILRRDGLQDMLEAAHRYRKTLGTKHRQNVFAILIDAYLDQPMVDASHSESLANTKLATMARKRRCQIETLQDLLRELTHDFLIYWKKDQERPNEARRPLEIVAP